MSGAVGTSPLGRVTPDPLDRSPGEVDSENLTLLKHQLAYMYEASAFYRRKLDEAGAEVGDIATFEDFSRLPLTTKEDLRSSQRDAPPFGDYLAADIGEIVRIHSTSGTTGQPLWEALTVEDVDVIEVSSATTLYTTGIRPDDIVLPALNYTLFMGGYTDSGCVERLGSKLVPLGIGASDVMLQVARTMSQTGCEMAVFSTPSYATYFANYVRSQGLEPAELGITKGLFGGEYGASDPAFRQKLMEEWNFRIIGDVSGASEVHPLCVGSCPEAEGLHYTTPGSVLIELIDLDTREPVDIRAGARGELVYSHLRRRAQPLLRYAIKDIVEILSAPGDRCACGRTTFRFRYAGRTDDMLVIRGVNVFPDAIFRILLEMRPRTSGEFQMVLRDAPPFGDALPLTVELGEGQQETPELADELGRKLRAELIFTPELSFVPYETLPRFEKKAKRVFHAYRGEQPPNES
jgi:phenylacetate-CoA ligase